MDCPLFNLRIVPILGRPNDVVTLYSVVAEVEMGTDMQTVVVASGVTDRVANMIVNDHRNEALREAVVSLLRLIDAAGLHNLSTGVQFGPTVWYVKASDELARVRAALGDDAPEAPPPTADTKKTIVIDVSHGTFAVWQGEHVAADLTWDEMLGQIATMTHPDIKQPKYRMRSVAQIAGEKRS